jgi:hypothetical protein
MRRMLLAIALLGFTVSAGAQAPPAMFGLKRFSSAGTQTTNGPVTHLTGRAVVWVGDAIVIADEAIVDLSTQDPHIEFRGNVVMRAAPTR